MSTTAASPGLDSISKGRCCRQQPVAIPACSACRTQHEPQSACQPPVSRSLPGAPHSTELNRVVENVDQSCRWGRDLEAVQKFPDLVKNGTGRFRRGLVRRRLGYSFHYFSLAPVGAIKRWPTGGPRDAGGAGRTVGPDGDQRGGHDQARVRAGPADSAAG